MKIVLAYSGGLDTSVMLSWIKENYDAEMIAFCANIGQEEELKGLEAKAKKTGASKSYIDDLQEEFARDFIFPMIQAGAVYEGQYFLGTSIARPLIAKGMIEIARKEKADALAHGATGKGNDQVRFELTAAALAPELQVIAPWRDARFRDQFPGRAEMIAYCEAKKIPVQASRQEAVFDGPQPPAHLLRGRHPGRSVDGRLRAEEQGHVQAERRPRRRAGQAGVRHAGFREGQLRGRERQGAEPAGRDADARTSSAANTASAAWTWWRTATWA